MIEVKNIRKAFGDKVVLEDVSTIMHPGKTNLIIGASGSGKTVLIKCIIGLIKPDGGEVVYEGKRFSEMDDRQVKELRTQIGMLFQGGALFDSMDVEHNIRFPLDMFTRSTLAEKRKRVDEVLDRVNLQGVNKKYPAELSGGMKKRVALARAIVMNPKYLFCDEPNSGLDPQTSLVIDKLIKEITEEYNITTVVNTHDMNTVMESGDNILYMYNGRKQWQGSSKDIIMSDDKLLNQFIFASEFLSKAKEMTRIEMQKK